MDRRSLSRIERMNYILGGVLVAAAGALGTAAHVLGAVVGVVLCAANFSLVRRIVERMVRAARGQREQRAAVLYVVPVMLGLMTAVGLAVLFLPISPPMLAVGFSVFLVSIAVETVRYVLSGAGAHRGDRDSDGASD